MKKTTIKNNIIIIQFRYDPNLVYAVKGVQGRKYNPVNRSWSFPISPEGIDFLKNNNFPIPSEIAKQNRMKRLRPMEVPGLKRELFRYQKIGVAFIDSDFYCKQGRGILGDDMQVGKSAQSIGWLFLRKNKSLPAVVTCPANVKYKWADEIKKFTDLSTYIIEGSNPIEHLPDVDVYIINYDILFSPVIDFPCEILYIKNIDKSIEINMLFMYLFILKEISWLSLLINKNIKTIIEDEAQKIKWESAIRTKAFIELSKEVPYYIPMTGTFIDRVPRDAFITLNILDKKQFPSFYKFAFRYCAPEHNGYAWTFNGASNKEELHNKLKYVMLRRTRKELGLEVPTQTEIIPIKIDNYKEYEHAEDDFIDWIIKEKGITKAIKINKVKQMVKIEYLKQIIQKGKIKTVIEWIKDFLESNPTEKLVVFAHHKSVANAIEKAFNKILVKIVGGVAPKKRVEIYTKFNNNKKIKIFLGSLAAIEGVPLKSASNVLFLELWQKPTQHSQASSRVQGLGQTAENINIWYFIAKGTIEEDLIEILDERKMNVDMIQDGRITDKKDLLTELIGRMLEKRRIK